jgi:hypothetical protein
MEEENIITCIRCEMASDEWMNPDWLREELAKQYPDAENTHLYRHR